jgi:hypothetical protein
MLSTDRISPMRSKLTAASDQVSPIFDWLS